MTKNKLFELYLLKYEFDEKIPAFGSYPKFLNFNDLELHLTEALSSRLTNEEPLELSQMLDSINLYCDKYNASELNKKLITTISYSLYCQHLNKYKLQNQIISDIEHNLFDKNLIIQSFEFLSSLNEALTNQSVFKSDKVNITEESNRLCQLRNSIYYNLSHYIEKLPLEESKELSHSFIGNAAGNVFFLALPLKETYQILDDYFETKPFQNLFHFSSFKFAYDFYSDKIIDYVQEKLDKDYDTFEEKLHSLREINSVLSFDTSKHIQVVSVALPHTTVHKHFINLNLDEQILQIERNLSLKEELHSKPKSTKSIHKI